MLTVRQASFRRMVDRGGVRMAEVEVHTDDPAAPEMLVYFRQGPKGYQLVRTLVNDARNEIDWFDNSEHRAFVDMTAVLFSSPSHLGANDRRQFAEQVLNAGLVRDDLDRQFGGDSATS